MRDIESQAKVEASDLKLAEQTVDDLFSDPSWDEPFKRQVRDAMLEDFATVRQAASDAMHEACVKALREFANTAGMMTYQHIHRSEAADYSPPTNPHREERYDQQESPPLPQRLRQRPWRHRRPCHVRACSGDAVSSPALDRPLRSLRQVADALDTEIRSLREEVAHHHRMIAVHEARLAMLEERRDAIGDELCRSDKSR